MALLVSTAAADAQKFSAVKIDTPPVIDGVVDPAEWSAATKLSGMVDERTGDAMPGEAQFFLAYDKDAVYFAAICTDDRPAEIRANGYRVNEMPSSDDHVSLSLDVTNSLSAFDNFSVNSRTATLFEASGGRALKREWVGEFTGKGRVTATGWECEARIPWRLLNLPAKGRHDARFNISRYWGRLGRAYIHTFYENGRGDDTPFWTDIEYPEPYVDRSIKLLPYFYTGTDKGQFVANSGLDIKTALTSQIQAIGSINPDFRNIENQVLSLDFSRFERLADESRPFFLEGNDYLDSAIFASQRIASFDVGSKFYGRLDPKTSFGFMDTFDASTRTDGGPRGDRNDIVASFERQQDAQTSLRFAATSTTYPGIRNQAYLVRASKGLGAWGFTLREQGSNDNADGFGRRSEASASFGQNGFFGNVSVYRTTENFQPRLGFVPQTDVRGFAARSFYERSWDRGNIRSVSSFSNYYVNHRDSRSGLYNRGAFSYNNFRLASGLTVSLSGSVEDFEGSKDHTIGTGVRWPALSPNLNYGIDITTGKFGGSKYQQISASFYRRWKNRFSTNFSYQVQNYEGIRRQAIASANYDLDDTRTISGRLLADDGKIGGYLSFRRSGNRGAEYFLILGDPNSPTFVSSLILKMSIPFEIKR